MVHGAAVEDEGAHAGPLRDVSGDVGPGRRRHLPQDRRWVSLEQRSHVLAHLLLGVGEAEVEVEVAVGRRHPGEAPPHPPLVCLKPFERRSRDVGHCHVAGVEMRQDAVDGVRARGARRAAGLVAGAEHEVVDEQLRAPLEELGERPRPLVGPEPVLLLDRDPRELSAQSRELVALPRVGLLPPEQLVAGGLPLLAGADPVLGHRPLRRRIAPKLIGGPPSTPACGTRPRRCCRPGRARRRRSSPGDRSRAPPGRRCRSPPPRGPRRGTRRPCPGPSP